MQGREQLLSFPRESCSSGDFGLWLSLSTCLLPQHCLVVLKIVINWEVRAQVTQTWPHSNQQIPGIRFHRRTEAITSNSYLEWKGYFQRLERKWAHSRDPPNLSGSDTGPAHQHHSWLPARGPGSEDSSCLSPEGSQQLSPAQPSTILESQRTAISREMQMTVSHKGQAGTGSSPQ